ncbi:MAG: DUF86 domain-containing protein [Caldilineaceae bacterium]|nr:DUF86 domain-containing protein [Caldilineaceae bacterium]MDE0633314.1 DUF86 domain-containing protein [Caldilineaceae bacterium]
MRTNDDNVRLVAMGVYATKAIEILGTTSQDELEQNEMMQFALIKLVEIVGEAANCVSNQTRSKHPEIPWSDVIGMRHRLVHNYEAIDLVIVRATIVDALPSLIDQLRAIVGEGIAGLAFPKSGS